MIILGCATRRIYLLLIKKAARFKQGPDQERFSSCYWRQWCSMSDKDAEWSQWQELTGHRDGGSALKSNQLFSC